MQWSAWNMVHPGRFAHASTIGRRRNLPTGDSTLTVVPDPEGWHASSVLSTVMSMARCAMAVGELARPRTKCGIVAFPREAMDKLSQGGLACTCVTMSGVMSSVVRRMRAYLSGVRLARSHR
jgi:hypothetical protein